MRPGRKAHFGAKSDQEAKPRRFHTRASTSSFLILTSLHCLQSLGSSIVSLHQSISDPQREREGAWIIIVCVVHSTKFAARAFFSADSAIKVIAEEE